MTARELKEFLDKLPPEKLDLPIYYFVEYGGYESGAAQAQLRERDPVKLPGWTYPERILIV